MLTLNYSVFAQVAKTGVDATSLPKGLRSQNHGAPVRVGRHALKKKRLRKATRAFVNTWRVAIHSYLRRGFSIIAPLRPRARRDRSRSWGGLARFRCSSACKAARAVAHRRAPSFSPNVSGGDDVPAVLGG